MTKYTDTQLKAALAKMLPEHIEGPMTYKVGQQPSLYWRASLGNQQVRDTELLHLCWLVEEKLTEHQPFEDALTYQDPYNMYPHSATWQQRVQALAKVKEIEIV